MPDPRPYSHRMKQAQGPGPGRSLEDIQGRNLQELVGPQARQPGTAGTSPQATAGRLPPGARQADTSRLSPANRMSQVDLRTLPDMSRPTWYDAFGKPQFGEVPAYVQNARPREFWKDVVQPYASAAWNMSVPGIAFNAAAGNQQALQQGLEDQSDYWTNRLPDTLRGGANTFLMYDAFERDPVLARDPLQNWAGYSLGIGAHALTTAATAGTGNAALAANAGRAGAAKATPLLLTNVGTLAGKAAPVVRSVGGRVMSMLPSRAASVAGQIATKAAPALQAAKTVGNVGSKALYEGAMALPSYASRLGGGRVGRAAGMLEDAAKGMLNYAGSALNPLYSITGSRVAAGSPFTAGQTLNAVLNSASRGFGLGAFAQGASKGIESAGERAAYDPQASYSDIGAEAFKGPLQNMAVSPLTALIPATVAGLTSRDPEYYEAAQRAVQEGVSFPGFESPYYLEASKIPEAVQALKQEYPPSTVNQIASAISQGVTFSPGAKTELFSDRRLREQMDEQARALNQAGIGSELAKVVYGGSSPEEVGSVIQGLGLSPETVSFLENPGSGGSPRVQAELAAVKAQHPDEFNVLRNFHLGDQAMRRRLEPPVPLAPIPEESLDALRRIAMDNPQVMSMLLKDPARMSVLFPPRAQGGT